LKQLQDAVGSTLEKIGTGNDTLNRTQKSSASKRKYLDCVKLKSCTAEETVTRLKRLPTEWKKIFGSHSSDKGLISTIYKKLKKYNPQRINTPMRKWAHELNRECSKEAVHNYMKKCSTSLAIKEMQIKTTLRFHHSSVRRTIFKDNNSNKCWQGCRETGNLLH
jgi:hypothetical protein